MKIRVVPTGPIEANCYIVYDEKSLNAAVIDPGSFDIKVRKAVEGLNVGYILLTHGHFDHILGASELKEATGAKLAVHRLDEECLTEERANLSASFPVSERINLSADILLSEGDEIIVGDIVFTVLHTPGHSRGSVVYDVESEKVLFTGDTLFSKGFGRTDFYGSNPSDMALSLKRLINLDGNYRVFPGHGEATFLDSEREFLKCIL